MGIIWNAELKIENVGRRGRRLPVAIALRFDRVGRREPPPTTKRNVCHIPTATKKLFYIFDMDNKMNTRN